MIEDRLISEKVYFIYKKFTDFNIFSILADLLLQRCLE